MTHIAVSTEPTGAGRTSSLDRVHASGQQLRDCPHDRSHRPNRRSSGHRIAPSRRFRRGRASRESYRSHRRTWGAPHSLHGPMNSSHSFESSTDTGRNLSGNAPGTADGCRSSARSTSSSWRRWWLGSRTRSWPRHPTSSTASLSALAVTVACHQRREQATGVDRGG